MIEPLGGKVLIRMKEISETTAGGIIIPSDSRYKRQMAELECEVMALGNEAFHNHKIKPKVGDWVVISKHMGLLYPMDGEDWRLVDDIHIQGILRNG